MNKKLNITIIGINYSPEDSSTGLYTSELSQFLASKNCDINVITGVPYYPQWEIWQNYKSNKNFITEQKDNINIYRYKQYVPKEPSFFKRLIHLFDFTIGSFFNIMKIKNTDVIICIVPFTTSILLGKILSLKLKRKILLLSHIQDFEFDAAFESGLLKQNLLTKLFKQLIFSIEHKLLNYSDAVSTISFGMLTKLKAKSTSKSIYFPNWIDPGNINPNRSIQKIIGSPRQVFKILYSGNIGAKQDWNTFIKLVKHYKDNSNIEFVIIGAGAKLEDLKNEISNLKNTYFAPPVPYPELNNLLCNADLHILLQKNDVKDTVMPSKLLGMMASAVPSLVTGNLDSEVNKVMTKSKGGVFLDSNDFEGLVDNILQFQNDPILKNKTGAKAREYIISEFSSQNVLNKYYKTILSLIN